MQMLKRVALALALTVILFSLPNSCGRKLADVVSNKVVLNVDGDLELDVLQDFCFWHPHSAGGNIAETMGGNWNITFGDYATMSLNVSDGKYGHIAAGTWWIDWAEANFSKVPLNQTIIVSLEIRVRVANYTGNAWLRIAIASAFQDPNIRGGYSVKYTELDLYDNPQALSHPQGNIKSGGSIIFKGGDVTEFRCDSIPLGEWRHYEFNLTRWHENAWGDIAKTGLLESVYIVIEVDCRGSMGYEGTAWVIVDVDNLWIYKLI
ncbi:MAG: hypothetical protein QXU45_02885 [Candidatus Bathyarchaeia archaeon]